MRSIIVSGVDPFFAFDVFTIEDPLRLGIGSYVIAVPRSPRSAHGIAVNNGYRYPCRNDPSIVYLSQTEIASGGLKFGATFARDWAGAGGDALYPGPHLCARRRPAPHAHHTRPRRSAGTSRHPTREWPVPAAERVTPLDGLAGDTPDLVSATALLVGDLYRTFGQRDVLHITPEGKVAPARWGHLQSEIEKWAHDNEIDTI
ncbi:hypothetical protein J5X84_32950 [Streptosporangiaceae bacterium NEAU-GS5]|nr:hypothetical protein [Streptosporangiaceae bacterium NEAU-GS5]